MSLDFLVLDILPVLGTTGRFTLGSAGREWQEGFLEARRGIYSKGKVDWRQIGIGRRVLLALVSYTNS